MTSSRVTLRPIATEDLEFLHRLYASTRQDEMRLVDWSDEQKESFVRFQFDAQHRYYQEQFPNATFDVVQDGEMPIGRLYVDRRADEIRLIDIALLPEHRGKGIGGSLMRHTLTEGPAWPASWCASTSSAQTRRAGSTTGWVSGLSRNRAYTI